MFISEKLIFDGSCIKVIKIFNKYIYIYNIHYTLKPVVIFLCKYITDSICNVNEE